MTAPDAGLGPVQGPVPPPPRRRRGRRPLLVLAAVVAGLGIAGAASGITLAAVGSGGGPGPGGPWGDHHRHGPPVPGAGDDRRGPGPDRLVPPDQD